MTRPSHPSARPPILVLEDEASIRAVVREVLSDEGYRVVAAATHADALTALRAARFALVLADPVIMPGSNADPWSSLECLKAVAGDSPVVIFTAHAPASFEGYTARGFAGLLRKPFDMDDLLAAVAALASASLLALG